MYTMITIDICYTFWRLVTQTVSPAYPGFQGLKHCVKYLNSRPHKRIFYPYSSYDGSNSIRLTWSGDQIEDYITQNFIECHQDRDNAKIINRRRSFSGIIHTLVGVVVWCKVKIQPAVAYDSTDRGIVCM